LIYLSCLKLIREWQQNERNNNVEKNVFGIITTGFQKLQNNTLQKRYKKKHALKTVKTNLTGYLVFY